MTTLQSYIAFLRAINVGGHTVKMAHLRSLFEELGFANVATFIASGNVVFEAATEDVFSIEGQIEAHLKTSLGYEVATFIRSLPQVAAVAGHHPFPSADLVAPAVTLYIMFLRERPTDAAQQTLQALRTPIDDFQIHGRELYWLCRAGLGESRISGAVLEKTLGMSGTMRNVNTVRRLAAKYPPAGSSQA